MSTELKHKECKGKNKDAPVFKYHGVKAFWGEEVQLYAFLTSVRDGCEWSVLHPGRFASGDRTLGTHWIGGWVSPRASLDAVVKRKVPSP